MNNYDKSIKSSHLMYSDANNLYGWVMNPKNFYIFTRKKKNEKCKKLIGVIEDKDNYVVHIRASKQTLNHGLILKRVHRVIQFN